MEVYLDCAATSHPKPEAVPRAVLEALTDGNANPGRASHARAGEGARKLLSCREILARAVGADDPNSIILTFNCTDALNLAIKGVLRPGDHVVSTTLEHNSVLRVLTELKIRQNVAVTLVSPAPDGFVSADDLDAALLPRTKLCVCTHVSNVTGAIQPVAEIGARMLLRGVLFLVDGAQALGSVPVDVNEIGCQMYAFPGHKGLLGPQGTGGLYLEPGLAIRPLREGGTGSSSESMRQPSERPERYESGTVNLPGVCGLLAGARVALERLPDTRETERSLGDALIEGLRSLGAEIYSPPSNRAGLVSFNIQDLASSQVSDELDRRGIRVRGGLHCAPGAHAFLGTLERGAVRASFGTYNTISDIETLLAALAEIARQ